MPSTRDQLEAILSRLSARARDETVFTALYADAARRAADAADARRRAGHSLGPLDGVIVSVKDLLDVAGEPTTAGSASRRRAAPAAVDAVVVARLRQAGAVILGKTNMTEFAFTAIGTNAHFGTPGNAVDSSRIPGGSSSGAGVSVAEGTSEISIGSDTGGSIRIPAALNGVVGLKPTARRIPLSGAFPLSPTLDSLGPLARSVAACAAADAVMAGEPPTALEALPLAGLRLGIPRGMLFDQTEPAIAAAFERSCRRIESRGARVGDFSIEDLAVEMRDLNRPFSIAALEGAMVHADWLHGPDAGSVDPRVSGPLRKASAVPAENYRAIVSRRNTLAAAMDARLAAIDALILPTTPIAAPTLTSVLSDAAAYDRAENLLLRNPQIANRFDLCSISLPMPGPMPGLSLPAGLMLMARHGQDHLLLRIAAAIEKLLSD